MLERKTVNKHNLYFRKRVLMLFFFLCGLLAFEVASEENKNVHSESGILFSDESAHIKLYGEMVISDEWLTVRNRSDLFCKWLSKKISLEELKNLVVFEDKDLIAITDDNKKKYDTDSQYFESCNYLNGYRNPLHNWGVNTNSQLEWPSTDDYIDGKYSVLLIAYLDSEKKFVRALYIDKQHQSYSNNKESMEFFKWDGIRLN